MISKTGRAHTSPFTYPCRSPLPSYYMHRGSRRAGGYPAFNYMRRRGQTLRIGEKAAAAAQQLCGGAQYCKKLHKNAIFCKLILSFFVSSTVHFPVRSPLGTESAHTERVTLNDISQKISVLYACIFRTHYGIIWVTDGSPSATENPILKRRG